MDIKLDKIEDGDAYLVIKKFVPLQITAIPTPTPVVTSTPASNVTNQITAAAVQDTQKIVTAEKTKNKSYIYWLLPLIAVILASLIQWYRYYSAKKARSFGF